MFNFVWNKFDMKVMMAQERIYIHFCAVVMLMLCTCNVELCNSDVHPHYFTNIAAQNAAKQRMTKYQPQKSLSNSARSVVKNLPPSSYKVLFSRGHEIYSGWLYG